MNQAEKATLFARLHEGPEPLVLPNPYDAGTAKILAGMGFKALTTTSLALAVSLGRIDGTRAVSRDEALANAKAIVDAVDLPVAADLENGYGDDPETVAETVRQAAKAGLVGCSIEDATGESGKPIYDFDRSVERVAAAAKAARSLPFPFVLVARAENFLHGIDDLDDTIRRLQAYEKAGADALYAPLLPDAASVRRVCSSVNKPVNVLAYGAMLALSAHELGELGVARISVGSGLFRVAERAFTSAARAIADTGRFDALAAK
jgi:2-methylisocitrate lyase-like PEP mutase family enzyme